MNEGTEKEPNFLAKAAVPGNPSFTIGRHPRRKDAEVIAAKRACDRPVLLLVACPPPRCPATVSQYVSC